MKLEIPYYSQKLDIVDEEWQDKACGITSLKMALDFIVGIEINIDKLIKESTFIGEHLKEGVSHETLVILARNYGINAYRQEFKSHKIDIETNSGEISQYEDSIVNSGIEKIEEQLNNSLPVVVSAIKKFKEKDKPHLVILIGLEENAKGIIGFYYNDPDSDTIDGGKSLFVDIKTFKKGWRKMAIFVYK